MSGNVVIIGRRARESEICAVVTRADGTVENLGRIAYYHRNPLKRWAGKLEIWWRRRKEARA